MGVLVVSVWLSDHAWCCTVEGDISHDSHQGHFLKPTDSVLVLQQVNIIHSHFEIVLFYKDLQLQGEQHNSSDTTWSDMANIQTITKYITIRININLSSTYSG